MRTLVTAFIIFFAHHSMAQDFFDKADAFFEKYVKEGLVDYKSLKADPRLLNQLVDEIRRYPLKEVSGNAQKAFYINAYNLLVIDLVVDHYPIEGPLKVEGFFSEKKHLLAGKEMTLDQLEKENLMVSFPDARLHFVLVCAAMGCPPLANFAYKPDHLENQLKKRTEYVLNFDPFIRVIKGKERVEVSKIFEWYRADFLTDSATILEYIDQYRIEKLEGKELGYYEYDWTLNKR